MSQESQLTRPEEVAASLHRVAIRLLRRVRHEDVATGLSAARLSALSVIVYAGPVTLTGLASAEQVRKPTMSRMVAELELAGLIRRWPDAQDGRRQWIEATPAARRLLATARDRRVERIADVLKTLSEARLARLDGALADVARLVEDWPTSD